MESIFLKKATENKKQKYVSVNGLCEEIMKSGQGEEIKWITFALAIKVLQ